MIYVVIGVAISLFFNVLGGKWLLNQRKTINALNEQNKKLGEKYDEALNTIQVIRDIYEGNANATRDELVERLRKADSLRSSRSRMYDPPI